MKSFARILLVISLQAICLMPAPGQPVSVSLSSPASWSPQIWSRIVIEITGAGASGPCRFVQEFPAGFVARPVEIAGGEFFLEDNTLNIVWAVFPSGKSATLMYEVMPEKGLSGGFTLGGTFYIVGRSNHRNTILLSPRKIVIGEGAAEGQDSPVVRNTSTGGGNTGTDIVFRVQVLSSGSRITDGELMKRLGVRLSDKITVLQSGSIYRYQVGECPTFECALKINESLQRAGVEGSFIVAFRGAEQLTVEKARSLQR